MTEYFRLIRPDAQTTPVVVDVPHAGEWIPDEVADEMLVRTGELRRDLDLYVDRIWQDAPARGATLIASDVSRYVVDLNRAEDDVVADSVEGAQPKSIPGYYGDRGVVWRTTTDGTPVMSGPLTRAEFDRRIETFHTPYHDTIGAELARVTEAYGFAVLIDGHSMPSMGRVAHSDVGVRRADIVPGDVDGTSCAAGLSRLVYDHFARAGYSVRPNEPYKGGWITRKFGRPRANCHAIQIEINRALYMDEQTFEIREPGMRRLARVCAELLGRLRTWSP